MTLLESKQTNKELQKKRMITYFVEATCKIIDEEGVEGVTVRKVANEAGYNMATLYNYFNSLEHLIFFASLRHLKSYAQELPIYLKGITDPLEIYLNLWKCFCYHSYKNPQFFQRIFFGGFDHVMVNDAINTYYSIFSDEISDEIKEFMPMFLEENIHMRDYIVLKKAVAHQIILDQDIRDINEMNVLIYRGMLVKMLSNTENTTVEHAVNTSLKYFKKTLVSYGVETSHIDHFDLYFTIE